MKALANELNHLTLSFTKRVRRNVSDYGIKHTVLKITGTLTSFLFSTRAYVIYRIDLKKSPHNTQHDASLVLRYLKPEEFPLLSQIKAMEEWLELKLDPILSEGGECLAALDGDRIAGFNLVSFHQINLPVVNFTRALPQDCAYSEQISVCKSYRGRNVATLLRRELFRTQALKGIRRIYGGADVNNEASLALSRKVGFSPVVTVRLLKLLGRNVRIIRRRKA